VGEGKGLKLSSFDYELPEELIAQKPVEKRDESRLLVLHKEDSRIEHRFFHDIKAYLRKGDILVLNRTRVLPARLLGTKEDTGGKIEFLLLSEISPKVWEVMVKPGRRAKTGVEFLFDDGALTAKIIGSTPDSNRIVEFHCKGDLMEALHHAGHVPLPPYIKSTIEDEERYQTVYSKEEGSAAAPTAGLHFTSELLREIEEMGVKIATVLLHVGPGTFRPVKTENIEEHRMHSEYCIITPETADEINTARQEGGRVICVGTTSCRTLETAADENRMVHAYEGKTDIFIYPGYHFKAMDGLITNFHLPKSTLLMLVSAFAGREAILKAYSEAVREKYRFFSFGDAMLIV
jgi:S-adenosylmethionine:tRNA ribosyltransferase-isomerase